MGFQYKSDKEGEMLRLTLSGRLDTLSAAELAKEVKNINESGAKKVMVDIAELDYISSSGLRCFAELLKGSRQRGASLEIEGMKPAIREIFDLTGFSKIFGL